VDIIPAANSTAAIFVPLHAICVIDSCLNVPVDEPLERESQTAPRDQGNTLARMQRFSRAISLRRNEPNSVVTRKNLKMLIGSSVR
jgi:hypothetical protein